MNPLEDEPLIHSHVADSLPDDHPLAFESVKCDSCGVTVHAFNNECMRTWIEFSDGNLCAQCVGVLPPVLEANLKSMPSD